MTSRPQCGICNGDPERRKFVDARLAENASLLAIERGAKEAGFTVKRETVGKHRTSCLGGDTDPAEIVQMAAQAAASGSAEDMAILVRAKAVERLKAGEIKPNIQDGLQAQALLDRRMEKAKDRELATALGRLLAGGATMIGLSDGPPIIEGEFTEADELLQIGSGD